MNQCCGNCNAWREKGKEQTPDGQKRSGTCQAVPATVILIGSQALPLRPGQSVPVTGAFFPSMLEDGWCRCWQPLQENLQ